MGDISAAERRRLAWRLPDDFSSLPFSTVIQRYGIYNPYTGRGAIKGLLPHGPHNLRDILATHILKQTGSYEQASPRPIGDIPHGASVHHRCPHPASAFATLGQWHNVIVRWPILPCERPGCKARRHQFALR
jgi:hypothetical protein